VVFALHVVVEEVGVEGRLDEAAGIDHEVVVVVLFGVGPINLIFVIVENK